MLNSSQQCDATDKRSIIYLMPVPTRLTAIYRSIIVPGKADRGAHVKVVSAKKNVFHSFGTGNIVLTAFVALEVRESRK